MDYLDPEFLFQPDDEQSKILKRNIDRAIQDLFLNSIRSQKEEFIFIFSNIKEIELFTDKIIKYWESEEKYEICSEIISLKKQMIEKWNLISKSSDKDIEEVNKWLIDKI